MKFKTVLLISYLLALSGCSTSSNTPQHGPAEYSVIAADTPMQFPTSALTGDAAKLCKDWSGPDIVSSNSTLVFNAAGIPLNHQLKIAERLDVELKRLENTMEWPEYRWLNSLPVINTKNGAAVFADSVIQLDRTARKVKIGENSELANAAARGKTKSIAVLDYILPSFSQASTGAALSEQEAVYKHFLAQDRADRIAAVKRYNALADRFQGFQPLSILPGKLLICIHREDVRFAPAEGSDSGLNLSVTASDQDIRKALIRTYQSLRTRAYGQLDDIVPAWFRIGQAEFHSGAHVAPPQEAAFSSPILMSEWPNYRRPDNFPALSAAAYEYLGKANDMSTISSLLDSTKHRPMTFESNNKGDSTDSFNRAFNERMQSVDGRPLTLRTFDYGWNEFIGSS